MRRVVKVCPRPTGYRSGLNAKLLQTSERKVSLLRRADAEAAPVNTTKSRGRRNSKTTEIPKM